MKRARSARPSNDGDTTHCAARVLRAAHLSFLRYPVFSFCSILLASASELARFSSAAARACATNVITPESTLDLRRPHAPAAGYSPPAQLETGPAPHSAAPTCARASLSGLRAPPAAAHTAAASTTDRQGVSALAATNRSRRRTRSSMTSTCGVASSSASIAARCCNATPHRKRDVCCCVQRALAVRPYVRKAAQQPGTVYSWPLNTNPIGAHCSYSAYPERWVQDRPGKALASRPLRRWWTNQVQGERR